MSRIHFGALVAALALATAALAACGSSGDSQDQKDITAAINEAATSGNPSVCTELQTQRFTDQTSGPQTGAAAVKSCQKDAADSASDSADVSNVNVDGDKATANVTLHGGFVDGQTLEIAVVKDNGQWKVDYLNKFTNFDRAAMIAGAGAAIAKSAPPKVAACITQQLNNATDEQLQAVVLDPNGGNALFKPCAG